VEAARRSSAATRAYRTCTWIVTPIYLPVDGSCVPDYRVRGRRPRTTGASLLVAPPDPGVCEDGSATEYVVGRIKRVRTRLLSALPLALVALEDGGSALPLAADGTALHRGLERLRRSVASMVDSPSVVAGENGRSRPDWTTVGVGVKGPHRSGPGYRGP